MSEIKERIENSNRLTDQLERDNGILDVSAIREGVHRAEEERAERQRKLRENESALQAERDKEMNNLLSKAGDRIRQEQEAKTEIEIKRETEKAQAELEAKIKQANNLKSDSQVAEANAYKDMLSKLIK